MAIAAGTKAVLVGSYDSSPFKLGLGQQGIPGGAVFTGTNLVYAYRSGGTLQYITCTPPIGQDPWTNVSPATSTWKNCWKNTNTGIETVPGLSMPAVGVASVTNVAQDVYIFSGGSVVYRLNSDESIDTIQLESANGSSLGSVGATAFPNPQPGAPNYILVGWFNQKANMLMWEAYDINALPSPIPAGHVWTPSVEAGGIPQAFQTADGAYPIGDTFGEVASMDWYSLGGNDFYLVTSYMQGSTPYVLVTPMGQGPLPSKDSNGIYVVAQLNAWPDAAQNPFMVARDAAGRMTVSICDQSHNENMQVVGIDADPSTAFLTPAGWTAWQYANQPAWRQSAATAWATGETYSYTYPNSTLTTTRQDVFQISFIADKDSSIWCDVQMLGIAEQQPSAVAGQLLPPQADNPNGNPPYTADGKTYTGVISGIIDAPFPLPASNVVSNNMSPGTSLGTVVYGATDEHVTQRSTDWSVGGGISSNFQTTAGMGPEWSLSVQSAAIIDSGNDQYSSLLNSQSIDTQVNNAGNGMVNNGFAFANNVVYSGTGYRMLDPTGNNVLAGSAPVCTLFAAVAQAYFPTPFTPYLVTAGDVDSYTRERINAQAASYGLVQPGGDYVNEVIIPNALVMSGNANCLTWSQAYNGKSVPMYLSAQDHWTETGWSLNISFYAGLEVGANMAVGFSIGAGVSFTVAGFTLSQMVGVNVSGSHTQTDETSDQVQIQFNGLNIPSAINPSDITEMTVEIYFLPANALWMTELASVASTTGLTPTDTNSQPWRLFFLVTYYKTLDGTIYPPSLS